MLRKPILIGFMGSGKSSVSKALAKRCGFEAIEMDELLIARSGLTSIPEIFETRGESFFRELETDTARSLADSTDAVISCGGGTIFNPLNVGYLRKNGGVLVLLEASFDEVVSRIGHQTERPLWKDRARTEALYRERLPIYRRFADYIIQTGGRTVEQIAAEIEALHEPISSNEDWLNLVIGDPVGHSLSPHMHSAGYRALGLENSFTYLPSRVRATELPAALEAFRRLPLRGISVTMPHKETLISLLDEIDPSARQIGAVNTILRRENKLIGMNTDWLGVVQALESRRPLIGAQVAILGAGGAARAACYGLRARGASFTVFNRSIDKAEVLAKAFNGGAAELKTVDSLANYEIVINATPLGMGDACDSSPLPAAALCAHHIVFDTVYQPPETRLLREARQAGATVVYGWEMLLYQGLAQFELYTGMKAPYDAMRAALVEKFKA